MDTDERVAETQRGRLSDKPCLLLAVAVACPGLRGCVGWACGDGDGDGDNNFKSNSVILSWQKS